MTCRHAGRRGDWANSARGRARGKVQAYTDGGTRPGAQPVSGWGMAIWQEGVELTAGQQRLHGEQSNDIAEAMAVIQAMRVVHPSADMTVYIDNAESTMYCTIQAHFEWKERLCCFTEKKSVWCGGRGHYRACKHC